MTGEVVYYKRGSPVCFIHEYAGWGVSVRGGYTAVLISPSGTTIGPWAKAYGRALGINLL